MDNNKNKLLIFVMLFSIWTLQLKADSIETSIITKTYKPKIEYRTNNYDFIVKYKKLKKTDLIAVEILVVCKQQPIGYEDMYVEDYYCKKKMDSYIYYFNDELAEYAHQIYKIKTNDTLKYSFTIPGCIYTYSITMKIFENYEALKNKGFVSKYIPEYPKLEWITLTDESFNIHNGFKGIDNSMITFSGCRGDYYKSKKKRYKITITKKTNIVTNTNSE